MDEDQYLLRLAKQDYEAAYSKIFETYSKALVIAAHNILGNVDEAKDIVQELFIDLWNKRSLEKTDNLRGYLFQSIRYLCYRRRRNSQLEALKKSGFAEFQDSHMEPSITEKPEDQAALQKAINKLSHKASAIIKLVFFEEIAPKQVAKQMGIAPNTVYAHVFTALRKLKDIIQHGHNSAL